MAGFTQLPQILVPEVWVSKRKAPTWCESCQIACQVCSACSKGLVAGTQVRGCEEGVHLHLKCYDSTTAETRRDWARSQAHARARMNELFPGRKGMGS